MDAIIVPLVRTLLWALGTVVGSRFALWALGHDRWVWKTASTELVVRVTVALVVARWVGWV